MGLDRWGEEVRNTGSFNSSMKEGTEIGSLKNRLLDENFVHQPDGMESLNIKVN